MLPTRARAARRGCADLMNHGPVAGARDKNTNESRAIVELRLYIYICALDHIGENVRGVGALNESIDLLIYRAPLGPSLMELHASLSRVLSHISRERERDDDAPVDDARANFLLLLSLVRECVYRPRGERCATAAEMRRFFSRPGNRSALRLYKLPARARDYKLGLRVHWSTTGKDPRREESGSAARVKLEFNGVGV